MEIFCHRGKFGCTDMSLESLLDPEAKGANLAILAPENSEESVEAAFKAGYNVEIDVVLTKDREVLVTHTNNLSNHSKDAVLGSFASEINLADILKMKTGMGGKTAPFLTYKRFLELLQKYDGVKANVEIKGTIDGDVSKPELQDPSLVSRLVDVTPDEFFDRIIWSSFALSNLVNLKKLRPEAKVAQLFCPKQYDGCKMYPDTNDVYMAFSEENLLKVLDRVADLEAVHCSIDNLEDERAVMICQNEKIKIRVWVLCEKNPSLSKVAGDLVVNVLKVCAKHPGLYIDFITDYADEVAKLVKK